MISAGTAVGHDVLPFGSVEQVGAPFYEKFEFELHQDGGQTGGVHAGLFGQSLDGDARRGDELKDLGQNGIEVGDGVVRIGNGGLVAEGLFGQQRELGPGVELTGDVLELLGEKGSVADELMTASGQIVGGLSGHGEDVAAQFHGGLCGEERAAFESGLDDEGPLRQGGDDAVAARKTGAAHGEVHGKLADDGAAGPDDLLREGDVFLRVHVEQTAAEDGHGDAAAVHRRAVGRGVHAVGQTRNDAVSGGRGVGDDGLQR